MLRALVFVVLLHDAARADLGEQLAGAPDAVLDLDPPPGFAFVPADARARDAQLTRAIAATTHRLARANLVAMRADLWLAKAIRDGEPAARALRDYQALVTDPDLAGWRALDGVLAGYGYALERSNLPVLEVYRRLVDAFPQSPYAARAHLVLGAAARDPATAIAHLSAAAHDPNLRAHALLQLGTLELHAHGNGERAFALFAQALTLEPPTTIRWRVELLLAKAYALFGSAADAFETFERHVPDRAIELALDLAARFHDNDRLADKLVVLDGLVRRAPDDLRACDWQVDATRSVFARTDRDGAQMVVQAQRLMDLVVRLRRRGLANDDCERAAIAFTRDAAQNLPLAPALARQLRDLFVPPE